MVCARREPECIRIRVKSFASCLGFVYTLPTAHRSSSLQKVLPPRGTRVPIRCTGRNLNAGLAIVTVRAGPSLAAHSWRERCCAWRLLGRIERSSALDADYKKAADSCPEQLWSLVLTADRSRENRRR